MAERRTPRGEQVKVSYTYNHPLGLRNRTAFIFCDCLKPGECDTNTKHAGEDKHSGKVVILKRESQGWISVDA